MNMNDFRKALRSVPDATPTYSRIAGVDKDFQFSAGYFRQELGKETYEGDWCFPVGVPGKTLYPPMAERNPSVQWRVPNYLGLEYYLSGRKAYHTGDDLDLSGYTDIGEPVHSPSSGVVTYVSDGPVLNSTWGNVLVIRLDVGEDSFVYTRFGHLNSVEVNKGDTVRAGQVVAYVGNMGMPTSPHLHWDITKENDPLLGTSPLNWPWDDRAFILAHYTDPELYIKDKMGVVTEPATEWKRTTSGLNVRSGAGTSFSIVTQLTQGSRIEVERKTTYNPVDKYTWVRVVSAPTNTKAVGNYVATAFLGPDTAPPPPLPPPPPPPVLQNTVGIHVAGSGHIGDLVGVLDRANRSGTPVPFVLVVSDPGLVSAIKRVSPKTVVVYRWVASDGDPSPFDDNGNGDGRAWVHELMTRHSQAPEADYHQFFNEVTFHGNAQSTTYAQNVARVEMDMIRTLDSVYPGFKMTAGNYMPGVPDPAKYGEALKPLYTLLNQHKGAALFHWYSYPYDDADMISGSEFMATRLFNYFSTNWPALPILIGEMGLYNSPRFRGVDSIRATWKDTATIARPYRQRGIKILIASWTIRGQNDIRWKDDDWTPHLNVYEADLKNGLLK